MVLLSTIALNVWLYISIPKTFFPEQDTGRMMGFIQADQSISFQAMQQKLKNFMKIINDDPAVDNVTGFTGGSRTNSGSMFISLKPLGERSETAQQIITRLRGKLAKKPGASLFLAPVQDIRVGGRQANASYQFTLLADDLTALREWEPKVRAALAKLPELADVNSDQQDKGVGGAMMVPVGRLTVMKIVPCEQYMSAMAFVTLPGQIGPLVGPALGGFLVEYASWHWIFLINLPVGVVGAIATLVLMPNYTMRTRRFDIS